MNRIEVLLVMTNIEQSNYNAYLNYAIYWLEVLIYRADEQSLPNAEPLDVVNAFCAFDSSCDFLFNNIIAELA